MTDTPKVALSFVGFPGERPAATWPKGWPVPPVDAEIDFLDIGTVFVRTVVWYPQGEGKHEPFVYVVLGPSRRLS